MPLRCGNKNRTVHSIIAEKEIQDIFYWFNALFLSFDNKRNIEQKSESQSIIRIHFARMPLQIWNIVVRFDELEVKKRCFFSVWALVSLIFSCQRTECNSNGDLSIGLYKCVYNCLISHEYISRLNFFSN